MSKPALVLNTNNQVNKKEKKILNLYVDKNLSIENFSFKRLLFNNKPVESLKDLHFEYTVTCDTIFEK